MKKQTTAQDAEFEDDVPIMKHAAREGFGARQPEIDTLKDANKRLAFHNQELQADKVRAALKEKS